MGEWHLQYDGKGGGMRGGGERGVSMGVRRDERG